MNTLYTKDGKIKKRNQIVIKSQKQIKDRNGNDKIVDTQIFNPTEDLVLANGWQIYTVPELSQSELLEQTLTLQNQRILQYDASDAVNVFYIRDYKMWLDKATRVGLKLRFDVERENGKTITVLWYDGIPFELELTKAISMLNALELYASECYDNTQRHIANIKQLTTVEEIKNYDYTTGYPEKLYFSL